MPDITLPRHPEVRPKGPPRRAGYGAAQLSISGNLYERIQMIPEDRIILNNSMKYPGMRYRLVHHIRELSEPKIQSEKWFDPNIFANFDEVVHFLFDESTLADDAKGCIGFYLADEREADMIAGIIRILRKLINELGDVSDDKYIERPEWPEVVSLAGQTLNLMIENDERQQGLAD